MPDVVKIWKSAAETVKSEARRENLAMRIFKAVVATTITIIIVLIPGIGDAYGNAAYLACVTSVFVFVLFRICVMLRLQNTADWSRGFKIRSPGPPYRFHDRSLAAIGACLGVGWSSFATFLSWETHKHSIAGAMTIKGIFVAIAAFFHGYVRYSTPRLFLVVLMMMFPTLIGLTAPIGPVTSASAIKFLYPMLTAIGVLLVVSLVLFPEFGSTTLANATIDAIRKSVEVEAAASRLFLTYAIDDNTIDRIAQLKELTKLKGELDTALKNCTTIYTECSFEMSFSALPPRDLKPISGKGIKGLVSKHTGLVRACESAYYLLGNDQNEHHTEKATNKVERMRPKRAPAETADGHIFQNLLRSVDEPLKRMHTDIDAALEIVCASISYSYDVREYGSLVHNIRADRRKTAAFSSEEIDAQIENLTRSMNDFGRKYSDALKGAAAATHRHDETEPGIDLMPREEVFLISSFVMNLQHAASHTMDMLHHAKMLCERRGTHKGKRSVHFPRIKFRKWLFTGSEEHTLPPTHKENFTDADDSTTDKNKKRKKKPHRTLLERGLSLWYELRRKAADFLDWAAESDAFLYASKFTFGVLLLTWPAWVSEWTQWYNSARGVWAPLIFVLVFENAVGSTIWIFALRAVGTIVGSSWGYAAYEARNGNEFAMAVMLMLGCIPNYYVQLGTGYQKAGMVCTISMCVVALSTHLQTVPGSSSFETWYKRVATMLIGGVVGMIVQLGIYPIKARERLKESLASAIVQINKMESLIAVGVDETTNIRDIDPQLFKRFDKSRKAATKYLADAATFLSFTAQEPRLKGDFSKQAVIYKEIIYVLRQITDRMANMADLRRTYGSALLEEYNSTVFNYRRNVCAAITLTLFVVHEALTTKLPLPQFLPSARLAHHRMVVRIRQILLDSTRNDPADMDTVANEPLVPGKHDLRLKFLSWNASSAALEECIEYLEELIELTKILVGANEFRSGLLHRPNYINYVNRMAHNGRQDGNGQQGQLGTPESNGSTVGSGTYTDDAFTTATDDLPGTLVRIQSRRLEMQRTRTRG